ncbi:MAG: transglycosylase SLT domain-containing protein [Duodenibacillus sp.]|nr:transglycosylase SLT domain-containing protein [Duodenibacillus sp.]
MGQLSEQFTRQMVVMPPKWKRFCTVSLVGGACGLVVAMGGIGYGVYTTFFGDKASIKTGVEAMSDATQTASSQASKENVPMRPGNPSVAGRDNALKQAVPDTALTQTQQHLARYLSRGYRVDYDHAARIVSYAVQIGQEHNVDPLLVLSIVAIESSLNPKAESSVGAQGLMQVHTRVHTDKFEEHGGLHAAFDPYANMDVGTQIIKGYIKRTGSVVGGLKWYVGASRHKTDGGYGRRVLLEKSRITLAAEGKVDHAVNLLRRQGQGPSYWDSRAAKQASFADYLKFDLEQEADKNTRIGASELLVSSNP